MEQEYRHMMEKIKFTVEEKERLMENIENKYATKSQQFRCRLIVPAVVVVLLTVAMVVFWRQVPVRFISKLMSSF